MLFGTVIAAIGSGVMAGFFFAFSNTVMAALRRQPAPHGIAAMQAINVTVLNPLFFLVFFGTALICLGLAVIAIVRGPAHAPLLLAASLAYLVGCIGVTMACNVPLNNALAAADPASALAADLWSRYLRVWTAWNHLRTVACLLAAVGFTVVLI